VCELETIGVPSIFNVIHSAAVLVRMWPTLDLISEERGERGAAEVELVTVGLRKVNS
jgi:hypothetical protein